MWGKYFYRVDHDLFAVANLLARLIVVNTHSVQYHCASRRPIPPIGDRARSFGLLEVGRAAVACERAQAYIAAASSQRVMPRLWFDVASYDTWMRFARIACCTGSSAINATTSLPSAASLLLLLLLLLQLLTEP